MLYRICSHCHAEIAPPQETPENKELISHGICRSCLEEVMAGYGQPLDDFLNSLQQPVFVVDQQARIVTANHAGKEIVGKNGVEITGRLGGEVFQCAEASKPGGCGNRQLCRSCVIRNSVMSTYDDGIPRRKVPAYHELDLVTGPQNFKFLISTEKIADTVFLRIDELEQISEARRIKQVESALDGTWET